MARMDDIAEEAGLSKGAVYLYFKKKDDIILAILESFFKNEAENLQLLLEAEGSVSTRLLALVEHMTQEVQQRPGFLSVGYEFYAIAGREDSVRQFIQEYFQSYRIGLAALIQQGIQRGEFRPIDADAAAVALLALLEGLNLLWVTDPQAVHLAEVAHKSVSLLLNGFRSAGNDNPS